MVVQKSLWHQRSSQTFIQPPQSSLAQIPKTISDKALHINHKSRELRPWSLEEGGIHGFQSQWHHPSRCPRALGGPYRRASGPCQAENHCTRVFSWGGSHPKSRLFGAIRGLLLFGAINRHPLDGVRSWSSDQPRIPG